MNRLIHLARRLRAPKRANSPEAAAYLAACASPGWDLPLDEVQMTVLDAEMTGLSAARDHLLSIGAVKVAGGRILAGEPFSRVICQPVTLEADNALIHRLSDDQVQQGDELAGTLQELLAFVGGDLVVGHAIRMDAAFLNRALTAHHGVKLQNLQVDTIRLHRWHRQRENPHLPTDQEPVSLGHLAKQYALPEYPEHNAVGDAMTTACLLLKLIAEARKAGLHTLRDLHRIGGV